MHSLTISTSKKKQVIDITDKIQEIIEQEKLKDGAVVVWVKHTTACITTADLDPGTNEDLLDAIEAIMPKLKYRHPHNPAHAPDHIASSIIGPSLTLLIANGELILGTWQRVILIELDGPREREITLQLLYEPR